MDTYRLFGLGCEEELFPWVQGIVRRTLRKVPAKAYEIEDMVAIGFLAVAEALAKYDPQRHDTFKAFVAIKARGAVLDEIGRHVRRLPYETLLPLREEELPFEERLVERETPEMILFRKERASNLARLVNELPEIQKSVVLQFSVLDRKTGEIAAFHGRNTRSFASKTIKKATGKLRGALKEAGIVDSSIAA